VSATIPRARHLLTRWLEGCGLANSDDLILAVGELITNAVRHGKGPIHLTLTNLPNRIRVEVHDQGGGHPAIRPIQPTGPDAGGWGLRMVDKLVDTWGTTTTGNHTMVWIEHALPATPS
jgi:anti-sigma regulatory factor (Ser/Thr protein kinase)